MMRTERVKMYPGTNAERMEDVTCYEPSDTFGNLALVRPLDTAVTMGTYEAVVRQFGPMIGPLWIAECIGCGARSVAAERWIVGRWVQCSSWNPACRDACDPAGSASSVDADQCAMAGPQVAEWTRMARDAGVLDGRDLRAELEARLAARGER
jgi:hypothetical protein